MTTSSLSQEQKYELITRRLQEVLGGDIIKQVLQERDAKGYWGGFSMVEVPWTNVAKSTDLNQVPLQPESVSGGIINVLRWFNDLPARTAHIGYFVPLTKIADFLHAGVEVGAFNRINL